MRSPHTWNRREFDITQNGYFTILKSAGWFSAVPLPGGFRYLAGKSKRSVNPQSPNHPAEMNAAAPVLASTSALQVDSPAGFGRSAATIQLQTIDSDTSGRHLKRLALIVVAATGLSWVLLWCTAFA
jgi:hypothetical protein